MRRKPAARVDAYAAAAMRLGLLLVLILAALTTLAVLSRPLSLPLPPW